MADFKHYKDNTTADLNGHDEEEKTEHQEANHYSYAEVDIFRLFGFLANS